MHVQKEPFTPAFDRGRGFTLVEVMVSLVVLSLGLLGVAKMVMLSSHSNDSAYMRTQATALAYEMLDCMRANAPGAEAGNYNIAFGPMPAAPTSCVGTVSPATAAQIAAWDMYTWKQRLTTASKHRAWSQVPCPGHRPNRDHRHFAGHRHDHRAVGRLQADSAGLRTQYDRVLQSVPITVETVLQWQPARVFARRVHGGDYPGAGRDHRCDLRVRGIPFGIQSTSGTAALSDSGRFALTFLENAVRDAGFMSCGNATKTISNLNPEPTSLFYAPGPGGTFPPLGGFEAAGTSVGNTYAGSTTAGALANWNPTLDGGIQLLATPPRGCPSRTTISWWYVRPHRTASPPTSTRSSNGAVNFTVDAQRSLGNAGDAAARHHLGLRQIDAVPDHQRRWEAPSLMRHRARRAETHRVRFPSLSATALRSRRWPPRSISSAWAPTATAHCSPPTCRSATL